MTNEDERHAAAATYIERLDDLLAALAPVEDALTDDEILNAPLEALEERLAVQGMKRVLIDYDSIALRPPPVEVVDPAHARPVAPIARPDCVHHLYKLLRSHREVVLRAPAGCGKTTFILQDFLRAPIVREAYPHVLALDCSALRMQSMSLFSREATWAGFETDDTAFKRFMADLQRRFDDHRKVALTELMRLRFRAGGLLVLDHVERIDRSGEVDSWLAREVFATARELGVAVLLAERTPCHRPVLCAASGFAHFELGPPGDAEIADWLEQPVLAEADEAVCPGEIAALTGRRMELLRDYGAFRAAGGHVADFVQWRLRQGYIGGCDRVVRVARRFPEIMAAVLSVRGLRLLARPASIPPDAENALLATGAIVRRKGGGLVLASSIYAHRLKRLAQADAIATGMARADLASLHRTNAMRRLKAFGEFAVDPIRRAVSSPRDPVVAFETLIKLLAQLGVAAHLFLRDDDNPSLWAPFHKRSALGPFDSSRSRNFARAAQSGSIVVSRVDGRVYIPVTGNNGLVSLVLVATFTSSPKAGRDRDIEIDALKGLIDSMRATLAQIVQRLAYREERRFELRLRQRQRNTDRERLAVTEGLIAMPTTERESLLLEAGCESIAILERDLRGWFVARFDRVKPTGGDWAAEHELRAPEWAQWVEVNRMDLISSHPSRRGVVLSGPAALTLFPRLTGFGDPTIYLQPVPTAGRGNRVIAILFRSGGAPLDGYVQAKLSDMVPDLVAFSLA